MSNGRAGYNSNDYTSLVFSLIAQVYLKEIYRLLAILRKIGNLFLTAIGSLEISKIVVSQNKSFLLNNLLLHNFRGDDFIPCRFAFIE